MNPTPPTRPSGRQPRVIAAWTQGMLLAAERAGLAAKDLLEGAGLAPEDLEDRDAPIDFHSHLHMVKEIVRQQPGISTGLRTGMTATPARLGVLGYVLRYANNLRTALADYIRFQRLVTDVTTWSVELGGVCRYSLLLHPLLAAVPSAAEVQIASIVAISRHLTSVHIIPHGVSFQHQPQGDPAEHRQFFECPVQFGAEHNELCLENRTLELPTQSADEMSHLHFLHGAEAVLGKEKALRQTSEAVRQYLIKQLRHGPPRRDDVARTQGKSVRTLLRHLEQEGQTYETLLDSCRRELALTYLANSRLAAFEIAGLVGYTEPSAFFRAFRRWTGATPQQHRRQLPATI